MASELVPIAKIKKPAENKVCAYSETDENVPVKLGQCDIPSSMERTRTGIQNSPLVWGDRGFGMEKHPNAKPSDLGK